MSSILRILYTEKKCNEIVIKGKTDCMREELFIETRKLKLCCLKIIKTDNAGLWCYSFMFVWRKNNLVNAFLL